MNKKNILNGLLLLFVAGLATLILYTEEKSTDLGLLTRINTDNINLIIIVHNEHETHLKKQDINQWQIEQPIKIAANNFRIKAIIKLLNAPVHKRYRSSEIDLDKIGLSNPKTIISFNDITISFGISNPVTSLRFVRIGETISTIEDVYSPLMSSHFSTLVSLDLIPNNSQAFSGIEKLILINQTISKNKQSVWKSNIDISADGINKALDHWQDTQAFGIRQYLKREQLGEIFIYLNNPEKSISYQITDTDPWLILARPEIGLEYHLEVDAYDNLIAPQ